MRVFKEDFLCMRDAGVLHASFLVVISNCVPGSSPSGSRNTQGMSGIGEEEDRHTQKVA